MGLRSFNFEKENICSNRAKCVCVCVGEYRELLIMSDQKKYSHQPQGIMRNYITVQEGRDAPPVSPYVQLLDSLIIRYSACAAKYTQCSHRNVISSPFRCVCVCVHILVMCLLSKSSSVTFGLILAPGWSISLRATNQRMRPGAAVSRSSQQI